MKKRPRTFPACAHKPMGTFETDVFSLCSRIGDCLAIKNWSAEEDKDVGFNVCKHLKMTLYLQINPSTPCFDRVLTMF